MQLARLFGPCSLVLLLCSTCIAARPASAQNAASLKPWGEATLDQVHKEFMLQRGGLYADTVSIKADEIEKSGPAFMWGCGVMLPALVAAAQCNPTKYTTDLTDYVKALDVYLTNGPNGIPGYDVLPMPKPFDRYYDDNMWVDIALVDAYDITKDKLYLQKAQDVFRFIASGEDKLLGGGIYWREKVKNSKNTCSNAPAIVAALRLYQATHREPYLTTALRLYRWTNANLQDSDGLFWDNIKLDGGIEKTKWSYNTALMLRANCLLYTITHRKQYLVEAERVGIAAEKRWVRQDTGAIADGGQFAHLLCEAFLSLYEVDQKPRWQSIVNTALTFVHEQLRDSNGHYGDNWAQPVTRQLDKVGLLSQACVARAFLFASHAQGAR